MGTAGVLLRATSALRVAQDFATLEMFFPGRMDLGIAGGRPGEAYAAELRHDLRLADDAEYRDRVSRLVEMSRNAALPDGTPLGPQDSSRPQIWLCGTSLGAARLAASLGVCFAYHHYLASPDQRPVPDIGGAYRSAFVSKDGSSSRMLIAAYGHCASSSALARSEWDAYFGSNVPAPSFLGTPHHAATQLIRLAEWYGADELAIDCFAPSLERRLEALADLKAAVDRAYGDAADAA